MCFEIDCVFACLRSYEGLRLKAHVVAMHGVHTSLYLLLVLQIAKIVYIDDSNRSNTTVSIPDTQIVFQFEYEYSVQ